AEHSFDHNLWIEAFDKLAKQRQVFFVFENPKRAAGVLGSQRGAADDVEMMNLQSVDADTRHLVRHREPLLAGFPWKAENQMRANVDRTAASHLHCLEECAIVVAAIYAFQGVVVDRFDAEFERDKRATPDLIDHVDLLFIDAVRPRPDRQAHNVRM